MEIITKNIDNELINLIQTKAKYQKVLVLFDDFVSNFEINLIHNKIKEYCIFNKMNINNINEQELFNGYKILIFICAGENFLKLQYNREEFINIYLPTNNAIIPFFSNKFYSLNSNSYLLLKQPLLDLNIVNSISLNMFFNYFNNIINCNTLNFESFKFVNELSYSSLIKTLNQINNNFHFIDLEVLYNCQLDYSDLCVVDLIIINAFLVLITAIKNNQTTLIDSYKSAKEEPYLLDKIYAHANNFQFVNLIKLNYDLLLSYANHTKKNIIKSLYTDISIEKTTKIIKKINNYLKNCNNLLFYLYTFDIFNI